MFDAFLQTKLHIPSPQADWVEQARLLDHLAQNERCKLILVSAPAGYGKTTLITEWTARQALSGDKKQQIVWLSLDEDDSDPQSFFYYLAAAVQPLLEDQSSLTQQLQSNQIISAKRLIKSFIQDVMAVSHPFSLILDDYHLIDSLDIDQALSLLLDYMPPHMTLVMTTRSDPGFPLSRLRARGELIELREKDLRFTQSEMMRFLEQSMGLSLKPEHVAELERRTEGWIAGLKMAALSMQNHSDMDGFVANFASSHRFIMDYLVEEVFQQQPEPVQQFLRQTAVLNRFNASLCNAVRQVEDSAELLRYIEEHNLFLIPLDDSRYWYRYHHLFADFFRMQWRRENHETYTELHGRASDWFDTNNLLKEALYHAQQANDIERLAALIIKHASSLLQEGQFIQLKKWLALLPTEVIQAHSILFIADLWVETTLLSVGEPEPSYDAAQAFIENDPALNEPVRQYLLAQIDALRTIFAVERNKLEDAQRFAKRALHTLPEGEINIRQAVNLQLGHVLRSNGDFDQALAAYQQVVAAGANTTSYFLALWHVIRLLRSSNRLVEAAELSDRILAQQETAADFSPLIGFILIETAALHYDRGRFNEGLLLAQQALPLCEQLGFVELVAFVHHLTACLYLSQQETALAQVAHNEVLTLLQPGQRGDHAVLRRFLSLHFARLQGDINTVDAILSNKVEHKQLSADMEIEGDIETAWAYLVQEQPTQALAIVNNLRQTPANRLGFWAMPCHLLTGAAHHLLDQHDEAQAALSEALNLAVPQSNMAPFFWGGNPIRQLMQAVYPKLDDRSQRFVETVFALWGPDVQASLKDDNSPDQSKLVDPLSERELEILQLLAAGMKNKEIAAELFISLNTVLYHNKNIFGKLGVNRRGLALVKARELKLIN